MERVAVGITLPAYNDRPPFHPAEGYPELAFPQRSEAPNWPYRLLRELLRDLGLDTANFGTPRWNPLRACVSPGQTVVLKPNFVLSFNAGGDDLFAMVTHPSILRALVDYVYLALAGQGRILIADVPQMDCGWDVLMRAQHLAAIQEFYAAQFRFGIEAYDLRPFAVIDPTQPPLTANRAQLKGDPLGSVIVNLGRASHFHGLANQNFYGADYDRQETIAHHHGETQEYSVSKTILAADTVISVPKMKTHKKVGVTLNLKGLVGINTNKNYLVHYRLGTPRTGGDQLPDGGGSKDRLLVQAQRWLFDHLLARKSRGADALYQAIVRLYRATLKPFCAVSSATTTVDAGNWHGNDSAWRMTADLAKILFFADRRGALQAVPQRRLFCVVDGIIAGEGKGPLEPRAKRAGCLVAGRHPFAVDMVTTRLMGFDVAKLPQFSLLTDPRWDFGLRSTRDLEVLFNGTAASGERFFEPTDRNPWFGFLPHPGWVGHIEV